MSKNKTEKLVIAHAFVCEFCGLSTPCGYVLKTGRDISTVCSSCADAFEFTSKYVTNHVAPDIALGIAVTAITG